MLLHSEISVGHKVHRALNITVLVGYTKFKFLVTCNRDVYPVLRSQTSSIMLNFVIPVILFSMQYHGVVNPAPLKSYISAACRKTSRRNAYNPKPGCRWNAPRLWRRSGATRLSLPINFEQMVASRLCFGYTH